MARARKPLNHPVSPEQGEAAAVSAARTIFRVLGHGPFMMHTTTTTAVSAACTGRSVTNVTPWGGKFFPRPRDPVTAGRSGTVGTIAVPGLVRAWSLLSALDNSCVEGMEDAHRHIHMGKANEAGGNSVGNPKAVLVVFVRGDERIFAERSELVPSDAEAERDSYGELRYVSVAVEG